MAQQTDQPFSGLNDFQPDPQSRQPVTIQKTLHLARCLQRRAAALQTPQERKQQTELDRMIQSPSDKVTLTQLTDQAFRSETAARAADQLIHILDVQGVPRFFSPLERSMLRGFQSFGGYLPGVAVPLVKDKMRRETANVILPAERDILCRHLQHRRDEGVRMNVNFLGEAILGENESHQRLEQYLEALQLPEIEVVSVKISTIYSQILPIARKASIWAMCERMERLYRAAAKSTFQRADGTIIPKFVYLDMEEYRDMSLTAEVFMRTLDRPGLKNVSAGIVFQAYMPDAFDWQQRVTAWARQRVTEGGAPITIRIVKGANMEMERVEASLRGWPQAPYKTKTQTDANYKRMLQFALQPENRTAARAGIASHNLFDVSYAFVLAQEADALADVQFEMLEGMANHQRRALHELTRNLLLYAPACHREHFIHAIGYLIRRLDENTGEENFLRHAFNITVDSAAWKVLEDGFLRSLDAVEGLSDSARRTQDRRNEVVPQYSVPLTLCEFRNEPDTDFSLPHNAEWAESIVSDWQHRCGELATEIRLYVAGQPTTGPRIICKCMDPSRPGIVVGRYQQATTDDVQNAVDCAKQDPDGWRTQRREQRHRILRAVAGEIRRSRAELMGAALAEGGKTLMESDPEVSEAVDFVEYYSATAHELEQMVTTGVAPRGIVVVVSPWNFPIAIPCGGIAAALAAGNTVILKPASHTVLVASVLCECFYRAGVPRTALQMLPCPGSSAGQQLVAHPDVDTVILTGGTDTAIRMLQHKPETRLLAETGGKNATIVTAMADRDLAIRNVIHSAFSHCGQKCSATSLLLLEEEVFDDETFRATLLDAVESMRVGSAWNLSNKLGPLIGVPAGDLDRGLKDLEPGETWALMPEASADNPALWTPGIKWNVQPGSYTHHTEFFGPVLAVMKFRRLREAIDIVNATGYGLTSGLESLDDREQTEWLAGIRAGNLYINRPTTGAIVQRQPFGGMGRSVFGPGIKAGGPNYVAQLMQFHDSDSTEATNTHDVVDESETEIRNAALQEFDSLLHAAGRTSLQADDRRLRRAIRSYDDAAATEFHVQHDDVRLVGQDNLRRYLPVQWMCVRVTETDSWFEIAARAVAARAAGCRVVMSAAHGVHAAFLERLHDLTELWAADIEFIEQSDEQLIESIGAGYMDRLRYAAPDRVPSTIRQAVIGHLIHIADAPVLSEGRIELLWYIEEQSVCIDYHRYGNLGARSRESRREVM